MTNTAMASRLSVCPSVTRWVIVWSYCCRCFFSYFTRASAALRGE